MVHPHTVCTLAAEAGWDSIALCDVFLKGLSRHVKDSFVSTDLPVDLDKLIALAIKVDRCSSASVSASQRVRYTPPGMRSSSGLGVSAETSSHSPAVKPMEMGRFRLTDAEKRRRKPLGLCLYCGEPSPLPFSAQ